MTKLYMAIEADSHIYRLWRDIPRPATPTYNFIGVVSIDPNSSNYMESSVLQQQFPECPAIGKALSIYKTNRMTIPLNRYLQETLGDQITVVAEDWAILKPHVEKYLKIYGGTK